MAAVRVTGGVLMLLILSIVAAFSSCHEHTHRLHAAEGCIKNERRALLAIQSDMYDPGGWFSSWTGDDCCKWRGVACDNATGGHVTKLDLRYPFTKDDDDDDIGASKVNPYLLELKYLKYLDLSMNNFSGANIPKMISSLVHLEYLNLSNAMFVGPIPPQLGNLSSLCFLDLEDYGYSQLESDDLDWLSRIPSLKYLDMSYVNLSRATAWLHQINSIPTLQVLRLTRVPLPSVPSPLPPFNLTSISRLHLNPYGRRFNDDSLLMWLSNGKSLEYLYLDFSFSNPNMKTLQLVVGALSNLKELALSYNDIHGQISRILRNTSRRLEHLELAYNSLTGDIPRMLDNLTQLRHLNLWANQISGEIPPNMGNLVHLEFLDLSYNHVYGRIPWSMGNLDKLVYLDLSNNNISGHIPQTIGNLQNLQSLNLNNNSIIGEIPKTFGKLNRLEGLEISNNRLSGQIPRMADMCNLSTLDLSNNNIGGELTDLVDGLLSNCPQGAQLRYLYLHDNNLSGTIPSILGHLSQLVELKLSSNSLQGPIPLSFANAPELEILILSHNHLNGNLPPFFCNMTQLQVLYLSDNDLSGNVPSCHMSSLTSLQSLHLSNNSLAGGFPSFLKHSEVLVTLDLGENKFSGEIPTWVGTSLKSLTILRLRSNQFHGNIPVSLSNLKSLQVLDLSSNHLFGRIPSSLGYLSAMSIRQNNAEPLSMYYSESVEITAKGSSLQYSTVVLSVVTSIDLSNNDLSGEIPEELTNLLGLLFLSLSNNHLTGRIPEKIGLLAQLESLDLSVNNLTGRIPSSLSTLNFLSHLNLSYNNLSGKIPTGNQLSTFNDPSVYAGNRNLCGPPLPECPSDAALAEDDQLGAGGDKLETMFVIVSIVLGFVVGFWLSVGVILTKHSIRITLFRSMDKITDFIYVQFAVKSSKLKSKLSRMPCTVAKT